ncbi:MAG: DKNYY domain-containing protein [Ferruginibacter sp.]
MLLLTGVFTFSRCSSGYSEKNGKILFNGREIKDKNFVVLSEEFAKDATTAYYKSHPFKYADVASFTAVDEHYAKDNNKVYYCDEYREGQQYYLTKRQTILEVNGALPGSFVCLKNGFSKDGVHAYFEGNPINVTDVATFVSIDPYFAKDDVHAYLHGKRIAGSNGKTFELTNRNYAKDTTHIYYYGFTSDGQHTIAILPCDKQSFEIIDDRYSKDKSKVFFLGFTLNDADGPSFSILSSGYAKDKLAVFFQSRKIAGAEPETFEVYKETTPLAMM